MAGGPKEASKFGADLGLKDVLVRLDGPMVGIGISRKFGVTLRLPPGTFAFLNQWVAPLNTLAPLFCGQECRR